MIVDDIPDIDGSLMVGSKFVAGKIFLRAISHFCNADNGILQSGHDIVKHTFQNYAPSTTVLQHSNKVTKLANLL